MALLIWPICLIWFKKTLCSTLYVLYALYGSKNFVSYLICPICLIWFKKNLYGLLWLKSLSLHRVYQHDGVPTYCSTVSKG